MRKTTNLKEFLKKPKRMTKVIEDGQARDSICSTISEYVDESERSPREIDLLKIKEEEAISCDIPSSKIFSCSTQEGPTKCTTKEGPTKCTTKEGPTKCSIKEGPTKCSIKEGPTKCSIKEDVGERINKIKQFTGPSLPHTLVDSYLVLPKKYLRLSKIFKALLTVQKYNTLRKLTSIFAKCKGCLERTLKTRVEEDDIKRLFFLLPEQMEIKRLSVEDKGETVKTFTFKISCHASDLDRRLLDFYRQTEKGPLGKEDVNDVPMKEFEEDTIQVIKVDNPSHLKEDNPSHSKGDNPSHSKGDNPSHLKVSGCLTTTIVETPPSSVGEDLPVQTNSPSSNRPGTIEEKARRKTQSILDRIKERERLRKEDFIKKIGQKNEDRDLFRRLEILFKKESKKAIRVVEIVKILEIYDGEKYLRRILKDQSSLPGQSLSIFEIKKMTGEDYLVYKG